MNVLIVYHDADYDGIFAGAVCQYWLSRHGCTVDMVGWDHYRERVVVGIHHSAVYVVDLPPDCIDLDSWDWDAVGRPKSLSNVPVPLTWIDHHAGAIARKDWAELRGLRIDGVAACRLAWQWFECELYEGYPERLASLPREAFVNREVAEPEVLRLVGEYDVWDKRDPNAEILQYGLQCAGPWKTSRVCGHWFDAPSDGKVARLLEQGAVAKTWFEHMAEEECARCGIAVRVLGIDFFALVSVHARGSKWFPVGAVPPEAKALMAIRWMKDIVAVSMYRIDGREPVDILSVARQFGGSGHEGACGFRLTHKEATALLV